MHNYYFLRISVYALVMTFPPLLLLLFPLLLFLLLLLLLLHLPSSSLASRLPVPERYQHPPHPLQEAGPHCSRHRSAGLRRSERLLRASGSATSSRPRAAESGRETAVEVSVWQRGDGRVIHWRRGPVGCLGW